MTQQIKEKVMSNLEGKVAVVAGGARDIGRAVSVGLAARGAKVVVNYFNTPADGEATVAAIEDAGGTAVAVRGDMTKQVDVESLVNQTRDAFGDSIDILVNVVGGLVDPQNAAGNGRRIFSKA